MNERTPPHSLEAERAVLGGVLVSAELWPVLALSLKVDDFYRDAHRRIFASMIRIASKNRPIDLLLLIDDLIAHGDLDECGGPAYLSALTGGVPKHANVSHYAAVVREKRRLRETADIGNWLYASALDADRPANALLEETTRRLLSVSDRGVSGFRTAQDAAGDYMSSVGSGSAGDVIMSGYADLDGIVGGFRPDDFVIIAARPSIGKTSFAVGIADNIAGTGKRPAVFSVEMSVNRVLARIIAWRSRVPSRRIERGHASEEEYVRFTEAVINMPSCMLINDSARTMIEINALCRRAKQEAAGLACVVIDYIQLLGIADSRMQSRRDEVTVLSSGLKQMARDLQLPVIALSQLSRAPDARRDKRPLMSDLRESGALEQDADIIVFLYRDDKPDVPNGEVEVIVAKNRDGAVGNLKMNFHAELAQFRNLAY